MVNTADSYFSLRTTITSDMALHEKAVQMISFRSDLAAKGPPRLDELYAAMTALQTLRHLVESCGTDDALMEADLLSSVTTRQLKCIH